MEDVVTGLTVDQLEVLLYALLAPVLHMVASGLNATLNSNAKTPVGRFLMTAIKYAALAVNKAEVDPTKQEKKTA